MAAATATTIEVRPEELTRLAVDSLQHVGRGVSTADAGSMSRRRFICIQTNSILIAILTCLTVCIITLSRVSNFYEFLFGNCGITTQLLSLRFNLTTFQNCSFASTSVTS